MIEGASNPNTNYGVMDTVGVELLFIGEDKAGQFRSIWEFDLSGFPGDVGDITSAQLDIYLDDKMLFYGPYSVSFRRCTQPGIAVATEVTWNEYSSGNSWATAGGSPTPTDKITFFDSGTAGLRTYTGFGTLTVDAIDNRSNVLSLINRLTDESDDGLDRWWYARTLTDDPGPGPTLVITYGAIARPPDYRRRRMTV